ncbi:MAG: hypothetical protein JWQ87_4170 [Candidatus Sulfotelmatobacter sp.]|nr:hypothetical protein [Candidatus Sulfotelmatobacter sp.]
MYTQKIQGVVCVLVVAACTLVLAGSASAATEHLLHVFTGGADGSQPDAGLTFGPGGTLYGSTFRGGSAGQGVVFKLTRTSTGWTEKVLYNFQGGTVDGANPSGTLAVDAAGNIFGTTVSGGTGNGVVFELTPSGTGWTETVLHVFGRGATPVNAGVIIDGNGSLYGETAGGGAATNGTVYQMRNTTTGWKYRVLYSFLGGTDGSYPSGGLIFDRSGNLYGTTANGGGTPNIGTVFELKRGSNNTWTESILHAFQDTADGVNPEAPVVMDASGNLYGTTVYGGDTACAQGFGCGEVFELSPSTGGTWTKTLVHAFTDTPDGHAPMAGLKFNKAGNLFGTTSNGGTSGTGALFELVPQSGGGWTESVVQSFTNGSDGGFPSTPVIVDGAGNLYGTTTFGGADTEGVAYAFTGVQ